jgi:hypothetical protein
MRKTREDFVTPLACQAFVLRQLDAVGYFRQWISDHSKSTCILSI